MAAFFLARVEMEESRFARICVVTRGTGVRIGLCVASWYCIYRREVGNIPDECAGGSTGGIQTGKNLSCPRRSTPPALWRRTDGANLRYGRLRVDVASRYAGMRQSIWLLNSQAGDAYPPAAFATSTKDRADDQALNSGSDKDGSRSRGGCALSWTDDKPC